MAAAVKNGFVGAAALFPGCGYEYLANERMAVVELFGEYWLSRMQQRRRVETWVQGRCGFPSLHRPDLTTWRMM